ncbi:DUF1176 domain-containing protein [Altererythrobacter sp. Z27]|uniref:DUF1176 domain-containing protein n=1 Tax=Altererythrobacter sp. Z27 TaxID=3461147 RepID=UPI0040448395
MIAAFVATALAAATGAPLAVYTDWIAGCDKGPNCRTVSLQPEAGSGNSPAADGALLISIARGHLPDAPFVVVIRPRERERTIAAMSLDGIPIDLEGQAGHFMIEFSSSQARGIIEKFVAGQVLSAASSNGAPIGSASMTGIAAALAHIEREQNQDRQGIGSAPLELPPAPKAKPARLHASELARRLRHDPCLSDTVMLQHAVPRYQPPPRYVRLDRHATMLILHDSCTGDNAETRLVLLDNRGRARQLPFEPEIADPQIDLGHDAEISVQNAWWDDGNRLLWTHSLDRPAGDCGDQSAYAWAGDRFVMVYHAKMTVCRGTPDFIVTYRRDVVRRAEP